MSYVTFAVGLLLAAFGAYAMSFGYGIVNVERGWASLISGAVLLSGGLVVMALALVLRQVGRLNAALRAREAAPEPDAPAKEAALATPALAPTILAPAAVAPAMPATAAPSDFADFPAAEPVAAPADAPAASIEDVRRVVAQSIKGRTAAPALADSGTGARREAPDAAPRSSAAEAPREAPADRKPATEAGPREALEQAAPPREAMELSAPPARRRAAPMSFHLPRAVGLDGLAPHPAKPNRPERAGDAPSAEPEPPAPRPQTPAAPREAPEPVAAPAPAAVVGRHESDGTAYVMFADGSIEATSRRGVFRFASMRELKAFMDSQPSG